MLRVLFSSKAVKNALASYGAFVSVTIASFLTVPIVVGFLPKEEIGLWTVINQAVGYLLWMDLGVGSASARKLADAVQARDQKELARWWTTLISVLAILGLIMVSVGLLLMPLALHALRIPSELQQQGAFLFAGAVLITGLFFPVKAAPGLLTAQERFHLVPIAQALGPWLSLGFFYVALKAGAGVTSYISSLLAAQLFALVYYSTVIYIPRKRPQFDLSGVSRARLSSLFSFSSSLCLVAIAEVIIASIPAVILARAKLLVMVPLFVFTSRGPQMLTSLVRRTSHSFYPGLLAGYLSQQRAAFEKKFLRVTHLTTVVAALASALAVCFNPILVQLLAGKDFFAGSFVNLAVCLAVYLLPCLELFDFAYHYAGKTGKLPWIVGIKVLLTVCAAWLSFQLFSLNGLALSLLIAPLIQLGYSLWFGIRTTGLSVSNFYLPALRTIALWMLAPLAVFICTEYLKSSELALASIQRHVPVPHWSAWILLSIIGFLAARAALRIYHALKPTTSNSLMI